MWTAGFVLLTLIVNAPLLPWVLRITGLSKGAHQSLVLILTWTCFSESSGMRQSMCTPELETCQSCGRACCSSEKSLLRLESQAEATESAWDLP